MELQESVLTRLTNLKSHDDAAKLFSTLLNYDYSAQSLSLKRFPSSLDGRIKQLQILAGHDDFKVLHCEVDQLLLGVERPIINNLLRDHPYSLFLFSDSLKQQWHFINVKYDEDESRRKIFRRIVIGPDERLHTAAQRIAMLEVPDARKLSPLELQQRHDEAFDVEAVTKDFFKSFVTMFHQLQDEIDELNPRYIEKSAEFSQMLLNRIMFLYFIQKKGWLNGNKNYLFEHFKKGFHTQPEKQTFYTDVVLRVFQRLALSEPLYKELGDIPFLNGGLFEINDWEPMLKIRNKMFGRMFKDLFEHYNFTVREDTALDMEVAIDPEMLGKVFENLILTLEKDPKTDLRKATGSYYTPRVIVHFMCQQSLKEYLIENAYYPEGFGLRKDVLPFTNNAYEKTTKQATLDVPQQDVLKKQIREKIEKLLTLNPASQLTEEELTWLRSSFTPQEAERMKNLILQCRVCDPAVGSGAFVVGMLHEMLAVIKLFDLVLKGTKEIQQKNYDYQLKRKLIENCLYGVDIQEQAVRICELRLWLSLVVDYEGKDIPPLPNLSYRIRRGNSLIDQLFGYNVNLNLPQATAKGEKLKQLIDSIQNDKHAYFYESDVRKKHKAETNILIKQCDLASFYLKLRQDQVVEEYEAKYSKGLFQDHKLKKVEEEERDVLQQEIKELDRILLLAKNTKDKLIAIEKGKLRETEHIRCLQDTFVWKIDFAEVFKEIGGFNIVISNPPWGIPFGESEKDYFRAKYDVAKGIIDSFALFIERSAYTLCNFGYFAMVLPDIILLKAYPSARKHLLENYRMDWICFWGMAFAEVNLDTCSILAQRSILFQGSKAETATNIVKTLKSPLGIISSQWHFDQVEQIQFQKEDNFKFNIYIDRQSDQLRKKIELLAVRFDSLFHSHEGIHSGNVREKLFTENCQGKNCKKLIFGRNEIRRFSLKWNGKYVIYDHGIVKKEKGEYANLAKPEYFENPKILVRRTGDYVMAVADFKGFYCSNNLFVCIPKKEIDLHFVTGLLNSNLMTWYFRTIQPRVGRLFAELKIVHLNQFPVYLKPSSSVNEISKLSSTLANTQIKEKHGIPMKHLEANLNKMIYELFSLTNEEIEIIEAGVADLQKKADDNGG